MYYLFSFSILVISKLLIINSYGLNFPYGDQWDAELNSLYIPYIEGNLKLTDLLVQHNEHRIFFTRILCLSVFILNDEWNTLLVMKVHSIILSFYQMFFIYIHKNLFKNILLSTILLSIFCLPLSTENLLWGFQSHIFFLLLFSNLALYFESNKSIRYLGIIFSIFSFLSLASGLLTPLSIFIGISFKLLIYKTERNKDNYLYLFLYLILIIILKSFLLPHKGHEIYQASSLYNFMEGIYAISLWPKNYFIIGLFILTFISFFIIAYFYKINNRNSYYIILNINFFMLSLAAMSYSRNNIRYGYIEERYIDFLSSGFIIFLLTIGYIINFFRLNKNYLIISHMFLLTLIFNNSINTYYKTKNRYLELLIIKNNLNNFISNDKYDIENYYVYQLENLYPNPNHFLDILNRSKNKIKINFDQP